MAPPLETRVARVLAVPARARLWDLIRRAHGPMTVAALAAAADLHVNTARAHLERLVEVGLAARASSTGHGPHGPGRPPVLYRVQPVEDPQEQGQPQPGYRELAEILAGELAGIRASGRTAERPAARPARSPGHRPR